MANDLVDLVKIYATNTGTGAFVLGSAVPSFRGAEALTDGKSYGYSVRQGSNYEVGSGVYSVSSGTLTRVVEISSNGGSPISLAPNAVINFPALAADLGRPGPAGPAGPPGDQGPPGADGAIPTDAPADSVNYQRKNNAWVADPLQADAPSDGTVYGRKNGAWSAAGASGTRTTFTATAGQTSFAATYTVGRVIVFLNGVMLNSADYTATTGTTVVLTSAAAVGDIVDVFSDVSPVGLSVLIPANDLSDVAHPATARQNLGAAPAAPQIQAVTSAATVTPDFANDLVKITAQAAALTLANWSGTAVPGWGLVIRIKDNGTARAISYGTKYRAVGVTLPTTTIISKTLYLACIYNADDDKFDVVAVAQEA